MIRARAAVPDLGNIEVVIEVVIVVLVKVVIVGTAETTVAVVSPIVVVHASAFSEGGSSDSLERRIRIAGRVQAWSTGHERRIRVASAGAKVRSGGSDSLEGRVRVAGHMKSHHGVARVPGII
jgi:hypothetical protein